MEALLRQFFNIQGDGRVVIHNLNALATCDSVNGGDGGEDKQGVDDIITNDNIDDDLRERLIFFTNQFTIFPTGRQLTSHYNVHTATCNPIKKRWLFASRSGPRYSDNPKMVSILALKKWAVEAANEKSDFNFLPSKHLLEHPHPPLHPCQEFLDVEFWTRNCQMKTIDTGRYKSFSLPETVSFRISPVLEGEYVFKNIIDFVGAAVTILSNRYESEPTFPVYATFLPIDLMEAITKREIIKYITKLPESYRCPAEKVDGIEEELRRLKQFRNKKISDIAKRDPETIQRFVTIYKEFKQTLHEIRVADPPFIICFSMVDWEFTVIWLRQREHPGILKYLPGFSRRPSISPKTFLWPRYDHMKETWVPKIICNNPTCYQSQGESTDPQIMETFRDYRHRFIKRRQDGTLGVVPEVTYNLKLCSRCKKARYCGVLCQKADLKRHKVVCSDS
ncbi:1133_t:CDS:2 [Ambispora gerdemannii]|uniref:1133_t:CDS:1 n=1 Tax=Ambispora gerdemannii TaxID=144530 RepID=A0A9N9GXL4_9GLOM|nr:1133_t:CDS:2 [Ambispora gerdemannii]